MEIEEGVLGSAENRFKLLRVTLNGLLLPLPLKGVRTSSVSTPLPVFGGGNGGSDNERRSGEREGLRSFSGSACAFPFGDDAPSVSCRLTQLLSRRNSTTGRRVGSWSTSDSGSTTGRLLASGELYVWRLRVDCGSSLSTSGDWFGVEPAEGVDGAKAPSLRCIECVRLTSTTGSDNLKCTVSALAYDKDSLLTLTLRYRQTHCCAMNTLTCPYFVCSFPVEVLALASLTQTEVVVEIP